MVQLLLIDPVVVPTHTGEMAQDDPKSPAKINPVANGTLVHRLFDHELIRIGDIEIRVGRISGTFAHVAIQAPRSVKVVIIKNVLPIPK